MVRAGSSVAWAPEGDMGVTVNQTELGQSKRRCLDPSGHREEIESLRASILVLRMICQLE